MTTNHRPDRQATSVYRRDQDGMVPSSNPLKRDLSNLKSMDDGSDQSVPKKTWKFGPLVMEFISNFA